MKTSPPASFIFSIALNDDQSLNKNVVICVFNNINWVGVHWSKVNKENNAVFTKMGREIVYIVMLYRNHNYIPVSYPFVLSKNGESRFLKPNKSELITIRLERKYPLSQNKYDRLVSMLGDKFQVANDSNFMNAKTIHTITEVPPCYETDILIHDTKKYRYCRYLNSDTTFAMIAEMKVFGRSNKSDEKELPNKIIGPFKNNEHVGCENLIDNNIETFAYSEDSSFWVGFDFSPNMLSFANQDSSSFLRCNLKQLAFKEQSFDYVYALRSIKNIPGWRGQKKSLNELIRVCRKRLVVIDSFIESYTQAIPLYNYLLYEDKLLALMEQRNFRLLEKRYYPQPGRPFDFQDEPIGDEGFFAFERKQ